jgi:arylsulfatase A-like enzyme
MRFKFLSNLLVNKKKELLISADETPDPLTSILATAVSFAVFTGLGEFAFLLIANYILHRFVYYWGAYLLWAAPLADLIIFAFPAIILSLIAWRWPKAVSLHLVVGVFAFLGFSSLLFLYTALQRVAVLILSAGLAFQTGRMAGAHPQVYYSVLRVLMGWVGFLKFGRTNTGSKQEDEKKPEPTSDLLTRRQFLFSAGATIAGLALGVSALGDLVEKVSTLSFSTPAPKSPNVLLIILDTVRARNLSLYGYAKATTLQLEKLAKNGVVFNQAVATASWTLPSHASMFTGRFPHQLSVSYDSGLNRAYPTLAEILSAYGYQTAGFVSNVWYCSRESGLNRGFDHYEDFVMSFGQILNSSSLVRTVSSEEGFRRAIHWYDELGRKSAAEMNSILLNWLGGRDRSRPFFAFVNYFDAHEPYLPPKPYDMLFGPRISRVNPRHNIAWKWTPQQIQAEENAYDGAIAYLDNHIGTLFNTLQDLGDLENTLVIIASDHGEEFLEHGVTDHGYSLYWLSLHVLLTLFYPGRIPSGVVIQQPASLRDLSTTVLDLVGIQNQDRFPGASLRRFWEKSAGSQNLAQVPLLSEVSYTPGYPKWYPVTRGDIKSLVFENFHYIKNGDGSEELYDFMTDYMEKDNLIHLPANQSILQYLRKDLESIL